MNGWLSIFDPSNYLTVPFGVPNQEQWPLFVLSKWALVVLPIYSVRYFNTTADWLEHGGAQHAIPAFRPIRNLLEKLLAHAMFYIGMGIPIIGIDAVLDVPRLVGFTLTNMAIHEALPILLSKGRFKRLFPEWRRTLGVNLIVDNITLEMCVFADRSGAIVLLESPHARIRNFVKRTRLQKTSGGMCLEVVLRRFFVPKGKEPRFFIYMAGNQRPTGSSGMPGHCFRIDFADLADYAMPVYVNDHGRRRWLWRTQYWTKFFNEIGGRSYVSTPFEIIRKFFLVALGTPLAFISGNMLVHYCYGGTVNLHAALYFSYGIIFAFTIGGMYGASVCSTLIEIITWKLYLLRRRFKTLGDRIRAVRRAGATVRVRQFNPYLNPSLFGSVLERQSGVYRGFRFLFGGILMGGVCSWGLTYLYGQSWDDYVHRTARTAIIGRAAASDDNSWALPPTIHGGERYITAAPTARDGDNRLFAAHRNGNAKR